MKSKIIEHSDEPDIVFKYECKLEEYNFLLVSTSVKQSFSLD